MTRRASLLQAALDQTSRARVSSASGQARVGLVGVHPATGWAVLWICGSLLAEFLVAVRLQAAPHPCVLCKGKSEADVLGLHSLCCVGAGG